MVTTSGFAATPFTRLLIFALVLTTLSASILDIKYLLPIKPIPHLWPYLQLSRIATFQLAYLSSTELIFAVSTLSYMRVLERLWGSRKFGSFVITAWTLCAVGTVTFGVLVKVLTFGRWGYIPPGLTGLVFAMLAVWGGEVPALRRTEVLLFASDRDGDQRRDGNGSIVDGQQQQQSSVSQNPRQKGIVFSNKSTVYVLAAQLALSQFPYQLLPAMVGWVIGVAWREELLPTGMIRWRIPAWMAGEDNAVKRSRGQYEGLRRRLEEEGGAGDGMREVSDGVVDGERLQERRGFGRSVMGYFTGS